MQIMKLTQKWVFDGQTRPKKICILKDQIGLIWRETVEREEEGEEKRKRKEEDSSQDQASQGMETTLSMDFFYGILKFV